MKKGKQRFLAATMALCLGYISCPLFAASATDTQNTPLTQTDISPRFSYIQRANADFYSSGNFVAKKGLFGYSTVDTLSETFYSNDAIYRDSFDLDSSETYRIKVTFEVFTADDSESTVKYANE